MRFLLAPLFTRFRAVLSRLPVAVSPGLLLLSGCIEVSHDYSVNPDGSGRVVIRQRISADNIDPDKADQAAREMLGALLASQSGIDAWESAEVRVDSATSLVITATALYPDIRQLGRSEEVNALAATAPPVALEASGNSLAFTIAGAFDTPPPGAKATVAGRSQAEIDQLVESRAAQMQTDWEQVAFDLEGYSSTIYLKTGSPIENLSNLQETEKGVAALITGKRQTNALLTAVSKDKALAQDLVRAQLGLLSESDRLPLTRRVNSLMYGSPEPTTTTFKAPEKPLFDYAAAVKAAQENPPAIATEIAKGAPEDIAKAIRKNLGQTAE